MDLASISPAQWTAAALLLAIGQVCSLVTVCWLSVHSQCCLWPLLPLSWSPLSTQQTSNLDQIPFSQQEPFLLENVGHVPVVYVFAVLI